MKLTGLSRRITLSMMVMALSITCIVIVTSFLFYYVMFTYWPDRLDLDGLMPTGIESVWIIIAILMSLILAAIVGFHLSRRILPPLTSLEESILSIAKGNLGVRANKGDNSLHEISTLIDNFNSMAGQLQKMTEEQIFWNASIAHELRTPVTVLRGRLQGLAENVFEPSEALFRSLLLQVDGLTRLIEDLRAVSLAEGGHLDIQMRNTDLSQEIYNLVDMFQERFKQAGLHPVLLLEAVQVSCDPTRIRQALIALFENTRLYASSGNIYITLYIRNHTCYLSVEDEGPGIDKEFIPYVFTAFRRAKKVNEDGPSGSGLGLAVVRAIILAHHGQITYQLTDKGGSLFEMQWPVTESF